MRSRVFNLQDHMTLIASGTGYIVLFRPVQLEGNSQRYQTIAQAEVAQAELNLTALSVTYRFLHDSYKWRYNYYCTGFFTPYRWSKIDGSHNLLLKYELMGTAAAV